MARKKSYMVYLLVIIVFLTSCITRTKKENNKEMSNALSESEVLTRLKEKYDMDFQVLETFDLAACKEENETYFPNTDFSEAMVYLCTPLSDPDFKFCATSYSKYIGSPIPRSGVYQWYFEEDFGIRIMDSRHFVPVASRYKLPYDMHQLPVFYSGVFKNSDMYMWQKAYDAGIIPFSVTPLLTRFNTVSVSDQNKEEIAGILSACMAEWNSLGNESSPAYDEASVIKLRGDDSSTELYLTGKTNDGGSYQTKDELLELIKMLTVDPIERMEKLREAGEQLTDVKERPDKYEAFFSDHGVSFEVDAENIRVQFPDGVKVKYTLEEYFVSTTKPYTMPNGTNVTVYIDISNEGNKDDGEKKSSAYIIVYGAEGNYFKQWRTKYHYMLPDFEQIQWLGFDNEKEAAEILDIVLPAFGRKELYERAFNFKIQILEEFENQFVKEKELYGLALNAS